MKIRPQKPCLVHVDDQTRADKDQTLCSFELMASCRGCLRAPAHGVKGNDISTWERSLRDERWGALTDNPAGTG